MTVILPRHPLIIEAILRLPLKTGEFLFNERSINAISISIQNRVGFWKTQTLTFNAVEMDAQITDVFPYV
jgi:hypothetical protein